MQAYHKVRGTEGLRGVVTGWGPTFFGYSVSKKVFNYVHQPLTHLLQAQGAFKYGGYEFFKKFYSDIVGQERARKWKTSLYLVASASAELIADVALCPFESVKVRMQTTIPPDISGTFSGISAVVSKEGVPG